MMTTRLKNEILLTISTYLDDRLSGKEKEEFEAHISLDRETREMLESLRAVKLALSQAPRRTAPRNFTLSQEIARKIRRATGIMPVFRFASATAAVTAMLLFAFSYLFNPITAAAPVAKSAQENGISRSAFEVNGQPVIITWGDPYSSIGGMGGGGGGDVDAKSAESFSLESLAPAESTPVAEAAPAALPPELQAESSVLDAELPSITGSGPILGVAPSSADEESWDPSSSEKLPFIRMLDPWKIAGLVLLTVAILSGMGAILAGKKK